MKSGRSLDIRGRGYSVGAGRSKNTEIACLTMSSFKSLQLVAGRKLTLARAFTANRISLSTRAPVNSTTEGRADVNHSLLGVSRQRASPESFQRAKRGVFFQPMPRLHNPFIEDPFLRTCLSNMLPPQVSWYPGHAVLILKSFHEHS